MKRIPIGLSLCALSAASLSGQEPATEITKWPDGKQAAIAITFDDSSINQFRVALPLLDERGLVGTFFVVTGEIPGSRYPPTFVGRPIMDILRESATTPTTGANVFERASMLKYLSDVQRVPEVAPPPSPAGIWGGFNAQRAIQDGNFNAIDDVLAKLRQTGVTYTVGAKPWVPIRSQEVGRPQAAGGLSWDELRREAAKGHEFASHTVSHPQLPMLDEANLLYEAEKARDELGEQLGPKHTFTFTPPYAPNNPRVSGIIVPRFAVTRNWPTDDFIEYIMRGNSKHPVSSTHPYVQWQHGPLTATTLEQMTGWVETSLDHGVWLVLVIHGINGVGYQPLPTERVRAFFDLVKAREDRLWVATFQNGTKYVRERMKSTIATKRAGQAIEVTVTHSLDPRLYDLPLTARTTVPAEWTSVRVRQGKVTRTVQVQREGGRSYVQYPVAPNGGAARLERVR